MSGKAAAPENTKTCSTAPPPGAGAALTAKW